MVMGGTSGLITMLDERRRSVPTPPPPNLEVNQREVKRTENWRVKNLENMIKLYTSRQGNFQGYYTTSPEEKLAFY